MRRPVAFWVDLALKAALIGLLLVAVLFPDLPQFEEKAIAGRALTYPLAALVVPIGWWLYGPRRSDRYPYGLDILLVSPFLIDVAGFGAVSAIFWEIAEYFAFIRDSPELETAYTDTLGDLTLGLSGSVVAALVTAWLWPRLRLRNAPAESGSVGRP